MTSAPMPKCPHCGFAVFNRRYPKCERCHAALPQGVVYSSEELVALRAQEEAEARDRSSRRPSSSSNVAGVDDYGSFGDSSDGGWSSDVGGSADGGSCGGGGD